MLFNSYIFMLLFLPCVLTLWWSPRLGTRGRLAMIVAASYCFYGWWDYRFVSLLIVSTLVDYAVGRQIDRDDDATRRKLWLGVSLACNLGLLAYFKYFGFFATSVNAIADWLRLGGTLPVTEIVLPVGISFYTFQTLSYSIDLYRGKAKPATSLLHFASYVALFPQLIAGPIVRYVELEDQLRTLKNRPDWDMMARGVYFFVAGMCQKILLADVIADKINPYWQDVSQLQFVGSWFGVLGYTCQLYFDFAAYSNMAVGLGLLLGFRFPQNFDSPYKAASISEFWRRWHMTLSFFLRDYLFIPLGGSRGGHSRTLRNLMLVMLLGGLWHGAGWTFVIWGAYHGMLLVANAVYRHHDCPRVPRAVGIPITFVAVVIGWVIFRSPDMGTAGEMLLGMTGWRGVEFDGVAACGGVASAGLLGLLLAICFVAPNLWEIRFRPTWITAVSCSALLVLCILRFSQESPFLYFQF